MTFSINISVHGQGRPLVLFHGWGFDSQVWSPLLPKLEQQYQLFLVDLPGFGASSFISWDTFNDKLISHLPEKFALLGWSLGGLYATKLALEAPQRVTHLVNVASSPRFIRAENWPGIELQSIQLFYELLSEEPLVTLQEFMALQLLGHDYMQAMPKQLPSVDALRHGLDVLVESDFRQAMHRMKQPVLYFFGRLDSIVPVATMRTMQREYPQFDYTLFDKAAHSLFLSHPERFIEELARFLS